MSAETIEILDDDDIARNDVEQEDVEQDKSNESEEEERASNDQPKISKTQMKKLKRKEAKMELRKVKRAAERERRKAKRKAVKESGQGESLRKPKFYDMATSNCPIHVAVDMSYEAFMSDDLLRKTITQLNFAYGANRRSQEPMKYHIVNLCGKTKQIFDSYPGNKEWDVFTHEESVAEIWPAERVVYLTCDSPYVLVDLDPNKVYIIGGLLDHNSHPGASFEKAKRQNFGHARLPIDEYVKLQTRKILTINQVFEIMLRYYETKNWETAFFSVIPKRKGMEKRDTVVPIDEAKTVGITPILTETQKVVEIPDNSQPTESGESNQVIQID